MNVSTRQIQILEQLVRRGELSIAELSGRFSVSEMTVRRDLNQLASTGLVVRTHGGAAPAAGGSFEPPFSLRSNTNIEAKRNIAMIIAGRITDGQTIVLDGGSTGVAIAKELSGRNLTVCALNLRVAEILASDTATKVMTPGGLVRRGELSFIGSEAEATFQRFQFDLFVMTVSGADVAAGFTEWNIEDAAVKRSALAASRKTLVACDSSKIGRVAFARICGLADVDGFVTDSNISDDDETAFSAGTSALLIA